MNELNKKENIQLFFEREPVSAFDSWMLTYDLLNTAVSNNSNYSKEQVLSLINLDTYALNIHGISLLESEDDFIPFQDKTEVSLACFSFPELTIGLNIISSSNSFFNYRISTVGNSRALVNTYIHGVELNQLLIDYAYDDISFFERTLRRDQIILDSPQVLTLPSQKKLMAPSLEDLFLFFLHNNFELTSENHSKLLYAIKLSYLKDLPILRLFKNIEGLYKGSSYEERDKKLFTLYNMVKKYDTLYQYSYDYIPSKEQIDDFIERLKNYIFSVTSRKKRRLQGLSF